MNLETKHRTEVQRECIVFLRYDLGFPAMILWMVVHPMLRAFLLFGDQR